MLGSIYDDRNMDELERGEVITHKCSDCGDWFTAGHMTKKEDGKGNETWTCDGCQDSQGEEDHSEEEEADDLAPELEAQAVAAGWTGQRKEKTAQLVRTPYDLAVALGLALNEGETATNRLAGWCYSSGVSITTESAGITLAPHGYDEEAVFMPYPFRPDEFTGQVYTLGQRDHNGREWYQKDPNGSGCVVNVRNLVDWWIDDRGTVATYAGLLVLEIVQVEGSARFTVHVQRGAERYTYPNVSGDARVICYWPADWWTCPSCGTHTNEHRIDCQWMIDPKTGEVNSLGEWSANYPDGHAEGYADLAAESGWGPCAGCSVWDDTTKMVEVDGYHYHPEHRPLTDEDFVDPRESMEDADHAEALRLLDEWREGMTYTPSQQTLRDLYSHPHDCGCPACNYDGDDESAIDWEDDELWTGGPTVEDMSMSLPDDLLDWLAGEG